MTKDGVLVLYSFMTNM
ncbi:hypothetical protein [Clostridium pasteurianum]|nr:hypothetical protein [Clostridium pasteurianum]